MYLPRIDQVLSFADLCAEPTRKDTEAFCERCAELKHLPRQKDDQETRGGRKPNVLYWVRGLRSPALLLAVLRSVVSCPRCGHALFWSTSYEPLSSHDLSARKDMAELQRKKEKKCR